METHEFEKLFAECRIALLRFVYYKTPSQDDGDDIFQEVALTAFQNRESLKNPDSFKAWIIKIASNKCRDFYRNRSKQNEIPLDVISEKVTTKSRFGMSASEAVYDTLYDLSSKDKQILSLYYLKNIPQSEIAEILNIPVGTVKSRLHIAKKNFKDAYPFASELKGEKYMKNLPEIMPDYTITESDKPVFEVKCEEMTGWFIVPKIGEKLSWAMYDFPSKVQFQAFDLKVTGRASVHDIEGVEIISEERNVGLFEHKNDDITRTFVTQLTDTHCRILSESHMENDIKRFYTFLDADDFNWGFGENNCGNETNLKKKGMIKRSGNYITTEKSTGLLDIAGRYNVHINGKDYDTICVMDIELYDDGTISEQYIDTNGRTVLWRRFNRDSWKIEKFGQKWSERFPDNERIYVNGDTCVHWYDCISDYIL